MLLLSLRFYASGSFLITVADFCGVSVPTASRVVRKVSFAIAELSRQYIKMPKSSTDLEITMRNFHLIASFPKVVGCIDCTHVKNHLVEKMQKYSGIGRDIFRSTYKQFAMQI